MSAILSLDGFGLAFGDRPILRTVSFQVARRGLTALMGPAGTGKSSLLRTLAGLNNANPSFRTWGNTLYDGHPVSNEKKPALVTQKIQLMTSTVLENLLNGLPNRSSFTRAQQIDQLSTALFALNQDWVIANWHRPVVDLALFEQRIVAILCESLSQPALLMLDEPTAGLSDEHALALCQLLSKLAEKSALLLASHHQAQVRTLATHVVLIASGITQEFASCQSFFGAPTSAAAQHFIRSGSCPEEALDANTCHASQAEALSSTVESDSPDAACFNSATMGPRGFVWLIPGRLAGTPWPGIIRETAEDLSALRNVGITRLVSLTEKPYDPALAIQYGIQCHSLPIVDMAVPTLTQAWALCEDISRWIAAGEVVALHCKAGLGRTGTLLAAYWLWLGKGSYTARQAVEHVRGREGGMIQSQMQIDFLHRFAELVTEHRTS